MGIKVQIHNIKDIDDFQFDIPTAKGLYALTGENGSGKSTVISCSAAAFYVPSFYDYFGSPRKGAFINFDFDGKTRTIQEKDEKWEVPKYGASLGVTGFYEGSIVFGNRFKDIDYSLLPKLSSVKSDQLQEASEFVKENLGIILHDDKSFYKSLYRLKVKLAKEMKLKRIPYYYENKGALINQLNMSTGENLLLTILSSIENRLNKKNYGKLPAFMFLDEIELALHSSALRRLVYFLKSISEANNIVVLFSTHSIELVRSISTENIFYLQKHVDGSIELINPCYPVYATRNLEASNYGHDYIIMVEDDLSRQIIERILKQKQLLSNKRVLVIAVGGWTQVLKFAYDSIRTNLMLKTTKIIIILDRDVKDSVPKYMKEEHINFSIQPNFLPVQSLEKFLLQNLITQVNHILFRELNDYVFQGKSLDEIISEYNVKVKDKTYRDKDKLKNGKILYSCLKHELEQIRKHESDLIQIIVDYLFANSSEEILELSKFLEKELKTIR